MPKINVKFSGVEQLILEVKAFYLSPIDRSRMTRAAVATFYKIEEKMFKSQGGQNPWQPLSAKYKKQKNKLGYGNMPIMQMTGALKAALTGKDKKNLLQQKTSDGVDLYLISDYWHNHQHGSTVPKRRTVEFTEKDQDMIIKSMLQATIGGRFARYFA